MKAREGDFIKDVNDLIFSVKGLIHPRDRIIAYPRYIPNKTGEREDVRKSYVKMYSLVESFSFLEKNFPEYLVYDRNFDERHKPSQSSGSNQRTG